MFDDIFGLLFLIAVFAGIFWVGFRVGYRYRDNLSLERQKKYRHGKPRAAGVAPAPPESPGDDRR